MDHRGTYDRGYLPHRDYAGSLQAITFRLADSVPKHTVAGWRSELAELIDSSDPEASTNAMLELHRRIAKYEDTGHGSCLLKRAEVAGIVQSQLIRDHHVSYRLLEWCIMPNHVHVLVRLADQSNLGDIVRKWKGGSSFQINRTVQRSGPLWAREYFDRAIRNEEHFYRARRYIRRNPVKAGLCGVSEDWPYSSAGIDWNPDAA